MGIFAARKLWGRHLWPRPLVMAVATCVVVWVSLTPKKAHSTVPVDLVLVLALDVSASVDKQEYELQKLGFANAFRDPRVIGAIARGSHKRIVVSAIQWSGSNQQSIAMPWTIVSGHHSASQVSSAFSNMQRRYFGGKTDISGTIEFTTTYALSAPVIAPRRVIDISGDGVDNVRYTTHDERDTAVNAGMIINALAILNEVPDLDDYYRRYVIGGPQSFVMTTANYKTFAEAILQKLLREINSQLVTSAQPPELSLARHETGARYETTGLVDLVRN